jgi:sugar phosphate permease
MNENQEKQSRSEQLSATLREWLAYLKQTFTYALSVAVLVGASFILTGDLSAKAYSNRLFLVGIIITTLGVFLFVTISGTRRRMGIPTLAKNKEEAQKILDHTQELRDKAEKRYDAGAQVWIVGMACVVLSILTYYILSILKY